METMRKLPFLVAFVIAVIVVLLEVGAAGMLRGRANPGEIALRIASTEEFRNATEDLSASERQDYLEDLTASIEEDTKPPGLGIPYLALIDGILAFTLFLVGLSLFVSEHLQAKVQGIVTLILSLLLIIAGIILVIIALLLLILMITLFFSPPFGTLAYLAKFGFFNTGGASIMLSLLMALKIGCAIALVIAHQRFLQNKGLVLLIGTSLLANLIVNFLHGLVPFILVSITDAVAAIIVGIIAVIWAIVVLIGAVISVAQAVTTR